MKNDNPTPPRVARRLLLFFLKDELAEEVVGDLDEKFFETHKAKGYRRARLNYWYQVINYVRPFALRNTRFNNLIQLDMFRSYFTIGWRNMAKHKMYSAINIGGFALGIAACLILALYIKGELSYDRHYADGDRIFRVIGYSSWEGEENPSLFMAHPFGDALKESFPEIETVGYYNPVVNFGAGSSEVRRTDRVDNTHEDGFVYMSQGMIDILEVPFIYGNSTKALTEPNTIVITRNKATKFFGDEDPVGKSLILNNDQGKTYTITGVIEDFPSSSHVNFDFIMTLEGKVFWDGERTSWCCNNYLNYVKVRPGTDVDALAKKFQSLVKTHMLPDAAKRKADSGHIKWISSFRFDLQPVNEIYLNVENFDDDLQHGDIRFIWLFGSIAGFILFLACINFVNLSTARSANRAKEVGIRKAIGSVRASIVRQFLVESVLLSLVALAVGILLTQLSIPLFNYVVGKSLVFPWMQWWLVPSLALMAIAIGIAAGSYPAFYLSSFRPVKVLKGSVSTGAKNSTVRSVLVVFQFTISITLIVGTIIVERQIQYALNKDLGFDKDKVMILHGTVTLGKEVQSFKNELVQLADVKSATISDYLPVHDGKSDGGSTTLEGKPDNEGVTGKQWLVDHDFVKTMGFRIKAGRDFDAKIASDSQAMIINESMVRALGIQEPVGQRVYNWGGNYTIIGVVEDFHFRSLAEPISPVTMFISKHGTNIISVKLSSSNMAQAIESVGAVWKKFSPNQPIRFEFLDDRYANTYKDTQRFALIVTIFASLAIVIACLGLFALSAFMIEQRGKELSIRMVLGAPVTHILRLLSQNFVLLIVISFAIAVPIAWYMMDRWLADYAYKIDVTWDVFAVTGIAALVIALLTIGYQSVKAAVTNPVANLKSE